MNILYLFVYILQNRIKKNSTPYLSSWPPYCNSLTVDSRSFHLIDNRIESHFSSLVAHRGHCRCDKTAKNAGNAIMDKAMQRMCSNKSLYMLTKIFLHQCDCLSVAYLSVRSMCWKPQFIVASFERFFFLSQRTILGG